MTREPLTAEQEANACDYDPWGERDATYRTLSDKFVTTRKPADCDICFDAIPVGSRVRAKREVDDGQAKTFRFCPECCWLMAHRCDEPSDVDIDAGTDNFERLMARYDAGRRNAESTLTAAVREARAETWEAAAALLAIYGMKGSNPYKDCLRRAGR